MRVGGVVVAALFTATSLAEEGAARRLAEHGDARRGRAIVADRQAGMCLLCHRAPIPEERFQGDLAPDLAGVGARLSKQELRARIVDPRRANPDTIMPAYSSTEGLTRVAPAYRGRTIFTEAQVEDVVAYLATLK